MARKPPLIILNAGHGGIIEGAYQTAGKRYEGPDMRLYEGVLNRNVVHRLQMRLSMIGIPTHIINPDEYDLSLGARINRANDLHRRYRSMYLSIHHNWFDDPTVTGSEYFTSVGDTAADPIAEMLGRMHTYMYPDRKLRRQYVDRYSKEARFRELMRTWMPAILTEWGTMSNREDREYITSPMGIEDQVELYVRWITAVIRKTMI